LKNACCKGDRVIRFRVPFHRNQTFVDDSAMTLSRHEAESHRNGASKLSQYTKQSLAQEATFHSCELPLVWTS
jgi:hypothetical protein